MKSDIQVASEKVVKLRSELQYAQYQQKLSSESGKDGLRPGGRRAEVERAGRSRQRRHQGGTGRGTAFATQVPIRGRRREHGGRIDAGRARPGALLSRQHADRRAGGRLHHESAGPAGHGGRRRSLRRDRVVHLRRQSLSAGQLLPGKPEVREAGAAGGGGSGSVPRPDLARQGRGDLAGKRRGTDAAERHVAELQLRAGRDPARPVRRGDHHGRPRPVQIPDRHAGTRGDLHQCRQPLQSCCARSRSAPTHGTTSSIPSPASARSGTRRCVGAGRGLRARAAAAAQRSAGAGAAEGNDDPAGMEGRCDGRRRGR